MTGKSFLDILKPMRGEMKMKDFFENNRQKLLNKLQVGEMAVLFNGSAPRNTADAFYRFKSNNNFYYFTGITKEHFIITFLKREKSAEVKLFIEKPDYDVEKWFGRKMIKEKATEISGIETIEYLDKFKPYLNKSIYDGNVSDVYFDLERLLHEEPDTYTQRFVKTFKENYLNIGVKTLHNLVSEFRVIKEPFEIEQIRNAIMLTKLGLEEVMRSLKPKLYEYQAEALFNHTIMMNGADGHAFDTIAASGGNAVVLHYVENECKIQNDTLILLDLGAQYKQYASDITRTYPANGKFTERQKEIYSIVLEANKEVTAIMKPGLPFEKMNEKAKEVICSGLKRIGLIEKDEDLGKYYYHGVGHYMGLDTHDLGSRETVLKPGMVITCEPGLYIQEENIGIRIEDDILITETGNENLSKGIIKEIDEIEAFMK
jgi:Xaa-Pro aminopeptidase